jgi:hypothetical protein
MVSLTHLWGVPFDIWDLVSLPGQLGPHLRPLAPQQERSWPMPLPSSRCCKVKEKNCYVRSAVCPCNVLTPWQQRFHDCLPLCACCQQRCGWTAAASSQWRRNPGVRTPAARQLTAAAHARQPVRQRAEEPPVIDVRYQCQIRNTAASALWLRPECSHGRGHWRIASLQPDG